MKVKLLLDECVDQRLAKELRGHVVTTVPRMGWASKRMASFWRWPNNSLRFSSLRIKIYLFNKI
jgi:hypothetical protein